MQIKRLKTRYSKERPIFKPLTKKAFLDELINEFVEDPYTFNTIDEAISYLSKKYNLTVEDLGYIKKEASKRLKLANKLRGINDK